MSDPINPYSSPQTQPQLSSPARFPRLGFSGLIAISTIVGGTATAIAIYLIYVHDPRTGVSGPRLEVAVLGGAALSSATWAVSGCFQRLGIAGLAITFVAAASSAGLWIRLGGTYADVLAAAACVGWPCGGLVASVCVYGWARYQCSSSDESLNRG